MLYQSLRAAGEVLAELSTTGRSKQQMELRGSYQELAWSVACPAKSSLLIAW